MTTTETLEQLQIGNTVKLKSNAILKDDFDSFILNNTTYTLEGIVQHLSAPSSSTIDYTTTVFIEKPKYSTKIIKIYIIKNRLEQRILSKQIATRGNLLWYAKHNSRYDSYLKVDTTEIEEPITVPTNTGVATMLVCPFCSKTFSSSSGRTLHLKAKHK